MRIGRIIAAIVVALVVWRGFEFVTAAGFFRTLKPKPLVCLSVGGVSGPEDVTVDTGRALAYISGYDRRAAARGRPKPGAIWAYDLSKPDATPVNLTPWADENFLPHGVSLYAGPDGTRRLFVVNHGGGRQTVEILEEHNNVLEHVATVQGDALRSPNDVAAVDGTRFYVTNDHWFKAGHYLRWTEDFLGIPLSDVLYYDGRTFRKVADGLAEANGIRLSANGKSVFVSATRGDTIHVYDRDPASGALTWRKDLTVPGMPDNIEPSSDGSLVVALHPKPLQLLAHFKDAAHKAPSEIVEVKPKTGIVTTLYLDLGDELSGASTGAVYKDRLLIGDITEPKFLNCSLG